MLLTERGGRELWHLFSDADVPDCWFVAGIQTHRLETQRLEIHRR